MFLVANVTYPASKQREMMGRFQKATALPLPSSLKRLYVLGTAGDAGMKVLGIYEVADDKVADGAKELFEYYSQYWDVEGFKYTLEPMWTAQETIALMSR